MKILRTAFGYLKGYPGLAAAVLASIILASLFEGASFGMLIPLIQSLTNSPSNLLGAVPFVKNLGILSSLDQPKMVSLIFALLFLILLVKNVFIYLSNVLSARLRFDLIRDLSVRLMDNLIEYDMAFYDRTKSGYLISVLTNETNRIGGFLLAVLRFVTLIGRVAAYVAILFFISFKISILIFLLVVSVLVPLDFVSKKLKKLSYKTSEVMADFNFKLIEIFGGIKLIKISGMEESEKSGFRSLSGKFYGLQYKSNQYIHLLIPVSEVVIFGLILACFLFLVNVAKIDITSAFPFIATYLVVLTRALTQLNTLNSLRAEAINNLAAITKYEELYDRAGKQTVRRGKRTIGAFSDSIEFRNVGFSYEDGKEVLNDISIKMPKGRITAIVGMSGVGKSTLVNLIMRFYDVGSGAIFVDGVDLKELELGSWRKKIGFVSQDTYIFNSSVKDNISYGRPGIGEDKIIEAAKAANAHDFIVELPYKYDTVLGERGVRLSGGQKQRLSIARAIISDPEILILDEATSSLDTETETLIKEAIDTITKDRTVIAIAHRLSTIMHADNIIVLEGGKVAETGDHSGLIGKNGLYKRLCSAQFNV